MDAVAIGALTALGALLTALSGLAYKVWPVARKLNHFVDDVAGEKARPGVPARPGLMERMCNLEGRMGNLEEDVSVVRAEVKNSHHTNLREDLDKVDDKVTDLHERWATTHGKD